MKIYSVIYSKDGDQIEFFCSEYSVNAIVAELEKKGAKVIDVVEHKKLELPKPELNSNQIKKRKYFNSQYSFFYKKYKNGNISKDQFDEIIEVLNDQKIKSKTKEDFKKSFKEYKKTLTIIPKYNVSE